MNVLKGGIFQRIGQETTDKEEAKSGPPARPIKNKITVHVVRFMG